MIKPNDYEVKRIDENSFEVNINVNPDLFYFKGHFEEQPILPKDNVVLKVVHNAAKNNVTFEYDIQNTKSKASSGRIKL